MTLAPSAVQAVSRYLGDQIRAALAAHQEHRREAVQTAVWLVTLASGLLTFSAVNARLLGALSQAGARWLLALLMLTVLFGAVHRFLSYLLATFSGRHVMELEARLAAVGLASNAPPEAHELHTPVEIVAAIRAHFGLEYTFLLEHAASLQVCQEAYNAQLELWRTSAKDAVGDVLELVAAYDAKKPGVGRAWLDDTDVDLTAIRRRAGRLQLLAGAVGWALLLTGGCFVGALAVLGFGLI